MSDKADCPVSIMGDAEWTGAWYASVKMNAPMVSSYRRTVKIYGNGSVWFISPDTARSMASALNHFADKAEAFKADQ